MGYVMLVARYVTGESVDGRWLEVGDWKMEVRAGCKCCLYQRKVQMAWHDSSTLAVGLFKKCRQQRYLFRKNVVCAMT
jgi:hypothetical protein